MSDSEQEGPKRIFYDARKYGYGDYGYVVFSHPWRTDEFWPMPHEWIVSYKGDVFASGYSKGPCGTSAPQGACGVHDYHRSKGMDYRSMKAG